MFAPQPIPALIPQSCLTRSTDWNIPKHLATFDFKDLPNGAVKISVYPHQDSTSDIAPKVGTDGVRPFFTATYKPIPYLPNFPSSTAAAKYLGVDLNLVQPPLAVGNGAQGELPGTEDWCSILPYQYSRKTGFGWWDFKQEEHRGGEGEEEGGENWWPGMGRWQLGTMMKDAKIVFSEGKRWVGVKP